MEEKDIITIKNLNSLTRNVVANFIDDEDKFIKQQTIDHIIQNGKYYEVINVNKQKIKILLEKGAKYEQLKKENEELKSENNEFCSYNKKIREENLKLKAELEELKENNIETKFKVGQTIYTPFVGAAEDILVFEIKHISIEWSSAYKKHFVYYYIDDKYYYEEKQLFSTKKEALKKLEEK